MKLAVITGCCGFIGQQTTELFLEKGFHVYGIDKLTYAADRSSIERLSQRYGERFYLQEADICDINWLPDCDVIINIAAESHVSNSIVSAKEFLRTNVLGTQNIIDILCSKVKHGFEDTYLLQYSTDEVYGDVEVGSFNEEARLLPSNPYAASKAAADLLILSSARTHGLRYNIIRPTNNYGQHQYHEKLIPRTVKQLQRGKKVLLHNMGDPIRTWLHVKDTAAATFSVHLSGKRNEIYNVSSNFEQSNILTVKKIINSYFNGSHRIEYQDWRSHVDLTHVRPGQDIRYSINDDKIRSLGWKNERMFDEEIDEIVSSFRKGVVW